ncbi:MAG: hypothetical protein L3J21_10395 [Devosiaceae bacterium]|nr:hypothetical protein [Devosiaceae bacterium]
MAKRYNALGKNRGVLLIFVIFKTWTRRQEVFLFKKTSSDPAMPLLLKPPIGANEFPRQSLIIAPTF